MSNWVEKQLGDLVEIIDPHPSHRAPVAVDGGIPFLGIGDLNERGEIVNPSARKVPDWVYEEHQARYEITSDTIGFGRVATIGKVIKFKENSGRVTISPTMAILVPKSINSNFLFYVLSAERTKEEIDKFLTGSTRSSLGIELLRGLKILLPTDPAEQARIAKILSTVDTAIEQTEALIAKYSRIRTGLMHDLLMRGDKLKSVPLSQLADVSAGITLGKKHEGPDTVERPYLRVANVQDGFLNLLEITYIRIPSSQVERYQLQNGDMLMNEGGDFDKLGRGTVWRDEIPGCLHQNHVFRVRCYTNLLLPDYLALISTSPYGKRFFVLNSKQSTNLASINSTQLKSFPIPLPDIEEQQRLLDIFKKKTAVLDTHQNHLAKLQTLKKGLMQDLLSIPKNTGKESENCN